MSATGRPKKDGSVTERRKDDDYETPEWCVDLIWPYLLDHLGTPMQTFYTVIDPCAGRGRLLRLVGQLLAPDSRGSWQSLHAREIDPVRAGMLTEPRRVEERLGSALVCDWLAHEEDFFPDLLITNPPYSLAFEFVQKAVRLTEECGGMTAMLLRLGFLGSRRRSGWMRAHPPSVHVISPRPSFTPDGKTDASEYAWFVWGDDKPGTLNWLPASTGR